MLELTPELEAEYATFWDAMGIEVRNVEATGIELVDTKRENLVLMFFPRSIYEYLTVSLMQEYGSTRPEVIRQSIFQERGWKG